MKTATLEKKSAVSIKKILYATDFSEASMQALPLAAGLARNYKSKISVVHVWSSLPPVLTGPQFGLDPIPPVIEFDRAEAFARKEIDKILKRKELKGLSAKGILYSGAPVDEIARLVREQEFDLLVVGTHGQTGFKHMVMGSVAEDVCRRTNCPVLTVGPNIEKRFAELEDLDHILVPTDLSDESRAVLPYIASLAEEYKSKVTVLHVLPPEIAANPDRESLLGPLRQEMHRYCAPALGHECRAVYRFEYGDPASVIRSVARETSAGLIALGVREAFPFITQLHKTIPYMVIAGATCPVLTVKASK
jgi:nucleotide-binding universal stress UspA family protein